jgi:4-hydroxybenzoate polyprenyltransferase
MESDKALDASPSAVTVGTLRRALRVEQWVKNLLVFVPLLMGREVGEAHLYRDALVAFLSFSLCASAVYVLNDLVDLEADRRHETKRHRPFAAGELTAPIGWTLGVLCVIVGATLASRLPPLFALVLLVYLFVTTLYTFWLKQVPLIDVITLGLLYTGRVVAGGAATYVLPSPWILAFSLFFFVSLAFVKRYAELHALRRRESSLKTRGYYPSDLELITIFGVASGYMAVLVAALYINGDYAVGIYRHPAILWLICPLLLYWVSRMWMLAHRGEMNEDPVLFAVRDPASWVLGAVLGLVLLAARLL